MSKRNTENDTHKAESKPTSIQDFVDAGIKPCPVCGFMDGLIVFNFDTAYLECDWCFTLRDPNGDNHGLLSDLEVDHE